MSTAHPPVSAAPRPPGAERAHNPLPKFGKSTGFRRELKRRVDAYFDATGRRKRDCPAMYVKTAIILVWFMTAYMGLVFLASSWLTALPLAALLSLAIVQIGVNIQHDGGHRAYSDHPRLNQLAALTLDLIGASSYIWRWKHGTFHHTYVNITGHDDDINLGFLARLTPHQRRLPFHRWQHLYIWVLYGFMVLQWHLYDNFRDLITGRIGQHRFPRPRGWDLVALIAGKIAFLSVFFAIPLLYHPLPVVLLFYGMTIWAVGVMLSLIFQLAHCVDRADFPMPTESTLRMENEWAIHQVETTVDLARDSRMACWLLGGLNFQVVHHLLPRLCHVNYPAISRIVEETCREFGVSYSAHRTVRAGLASHYRWLRKMGRPDASASPSRG